MKLIHLSDLHIGKRVNGFSMLEDQKEILSQVVSIAEDERAEGMILAGDIYDKAMPSGEAVSLLDELLTKLADLNVAVYAISGNHDSPERIAFGSQLMNSRGVHLSRVYDGTVEPVCFQDDYGTVAIYLLPFVKPAIVRNVFPDEIIESYQDAVRSAIEHMEVKPENQNILIAHQFVTGANRCDSEEVTVGGVDNIDASIFEPFDYVALGHIHSPQWVGRETIRYCGTPLKYSFSEAEQEKSVTIIETREKGDISIRLRPLIPSRDMRKIKGTYMEVSARKAYENLSKDDYLHITLTDEENILDGIQKLRVIYPNVMKLEYDNQRTRENRLVDGIDVMEEKTTLELVEEFYELRNNQPMSDKQKTLVQTIIDKL